MVEYGWVREEGYLEFKDPGGAGVTVAFAISATLHLEYGFCGPDGIPDVSDAGEGGCLG